MGAEDWMPYDLGMFDDEEMMGDYWNRDEHSIIRPAAGDLGLFDDYEVPFTIQLRIIVIHELKPLGAWLYKSAYSGSQYIKFADGRVGSLRIGDHPGYSQYSYRWNIGSHLQTHTEVDRGILRYYFHYDDLEQFFLEISNYAKEVSNRKPQKTKPFDLNRLTFPGGSS